MGLLGELRSLLAEGHGSGWSQDTSCPLRPGEHTGGNRLVWEGLARVTGSRHCPPPVHHLSTNEARGPPCPMPNFPENRNLAAWSSAEPWTVSGGPSYSVPTLMASAVCGRSWALRLAMSKRKVFSLRGRASLWFWGTLNLAAVQRTAATAYTEAWVEKSPALLSGLPRGARAGQQPWETLPLCTCLEPGGPGKTPSQIPRGPGLGTCTFTKHPRVFTLTREASMGPARSHGPQAGGGRSSGV